MLKKKRLVKNNLTKTITTTVIATGIYVPFSLTTVYADEIKTVDKQIIELKSEETGNTKENEINKSDKQNLELGLIGVGWEDKDGNIIEGYGSEKKKQDTNPESEKENVETIKKGTITDSNKLDNDNESKLQKQNPKLGLIGIGWEDKDGNIIEGYGSEKKKQDTNPESEKENVETIKKEAIIALDKLDKDELQFQKQYPDNQIGRGDFAVNLGAYEEMINKSKDIEQIKLYLDGVKSLALERKLEIIKGDMSKNIEKSKEYNFTKPKLKEEFKAISNLANQNLKRIEEYYKEIRALNGKLNSIESSTLTKEKIEEYRNIADEIKRKGEKYIGEVEHFSDIFRNKQKELVILDKVQEEPGNPGTSNPETSNPEASNPEANKPETSNPETSNPEASNPEASNPEASNPETSNPEANNPETSNPETSNPEASNPETSNPETSNPETSNPEASNPETSNPEASNPEASNPETSNPEASNPETSNPEASNPEASNPETSNPEASNPETSNPEASNPEANNPETSNPETSNPEASNPETSNPETSNPEASNPEANKPETSNPETSNPEANKPETSNPETSNPEASNPETSNPETSNPEASNPETSNPEASNPEASNPETSNPETSNPEASNPEANNPEANKPETNKFVKEYKKKEIKDNLNPKTGDSSILGFSALGFSGLLGLVLSKIKYRNK
ncbi:Ribonucleases G and E [[Clostridium] sordellii]|nr:hypothetical protein [Paeniclostridium sordellii]CEQ29812.1 Ribonucleases G and E [[Clostridium] sordellii] [Paeniclostridium sordellii]